MWPKLRKLITEKIITPNFKRNSFIANYPICSDRSCFLRMKASFLHNEEIRDGGC